MNMYPDSKPSLWSRLIVVPTVLGLVATSMLMGYASSRWSDGHRDRARPLLHSFQLVRHETGETTAQEEAQGEGDISGPPDDPIANYKAALALIEKDYYGPPITAQKRRQLTYESVRGMLFSLRDQFTSFLDPEEGRAMQEMTSGEFEGIGAILQQDGVKVKVVRPLKGSPAEHKGVKAEDVIVSVDGESVVGKTVDDVVKKVRGPHDTPVVIGVIRGKEQTPMSFRIVRATVESPIVQYWMEDSQAKIGHIVLSEFNDKSIEQMNKAYADLTKQGMRALVFDLRYNPGGLLKVAIGVASEFIPTGTRSELDDAVVYIREGNGRESPLRLHSSNTYPPLPLVVLVNGNSASASEIVSAAIKDYGIGTLIGERTYGKGKVQTLFPLADGSVLRLTTQLYFPPTKYDINFTRDAEGNRVKDTGGVVPHILVKQSDKWRTEDFEDKANDTQLQKALEFLRARLAGKSVAQATQLVQQTAH